MGVFRRRIVIQYNGAKSERKILRKYLILLEDDHRAVFCFRAKSNGLVCSPS